jgi:hypothetical protein
MQWRAADICVAVSELDEQAMRNGGARQVVVVPNGTDPVPRQPIPHRAAGEPLKLLFIGAPYLPNVLAVEWLVRDVLPLSGGGQPCPSTSSVCFRIRCLPPRA